MKNIRKSFNLAIILFLIFLINFNFSQSFVQGLSPHQSQNSQCITYNQRIQIREMLEYNKSILREQGIIPENFENRIPIDFSWPVQQADHHQNFDFWNISAYGDHDYYTNTLLDFNCGQRTYNGHLGVDIYSMPYSWRMMDSSDVEIIAAAPGNILGKIDGNYDTNCGEGGTDWNAVYIIHEDGSEAWYGHMKLNSLTDKNVGDPIEAGEFLGIMGSSGFSSGPHLHLELWNYNSQFGTYSVIDPYEGECNSTNSLSLWEDQPEYINPALIDISTFSPGPWYPPCPQREVPNEKYIFSPGENITVGAFLRDIGNNTPFETTIFDPNGEQIDQSDYTYFGELYYWFYYYSLFQIPSNAELGEWSYIVYYDGEFYEKTFTVGEAGCMNPYSPNYNAIAVQDDGSCTICSGQQVEVYIDFDANADQTYWSINEESNYRTLYSKQHNFPQSWYGCLPEGNYVFNAMDTFGDGICCLNGMGSIHLIIDDEVMFSASQFEYIETFEFSINGQLLGDLNFDGTVNIQDILFLINIVLGNVIPNENQQIAGDLNGDNILNVSDIIMVVQVILNS